MKTDKNLLYCPICKSEHGKHLVLGEIRPDGSFFVMRFHSGTTLLNAPHLTVSCGCGFSYYLTGTTIEGTAMLLV